MRDQDYEDTELDPGPPSFTSRYRTMFDVPLTHKIIAAVACACVVGGGTVVLQNAQKIAVLEYASVAQGERLIRMEDKIDRLLLKTDPAK